MHMDHLHSSLKIDLAQKSDRGRKDENQDTIGARIPEGSALASKGIAIAIADGVSSSDSAKQASQSAVTGFLNDYYATPDTWRTQQSAIQVIQSLNQYLWGQSRNNVRQEGFLTTFSCLILKGDKSFIFHIGDSRVYRLRNGYLEQLTRDHSQRIDRNTTYLSRAMGADPALEIEMHSEELQAGDVFLLSTDGIHDFIRRSELCEELKSNARLEDKCEKLLQLALENTSKDNLSVQIVEIESIGTSSQSDAVTVLSKLPFPPDMNVGNKIDGLRIEKILHESERSQVFLVKDAQEKTYVMKTPSRNYDDDPAYIERFVLEAWIGARIQNSHVVRVIPPPKERTFLYYLTEHISGPTLAELILQRAPFAITDAVEIIEQLVKGVRAFHRKDTLHQDIKPDNIILGVQGVAIIDFGSCWIAGIEEAGAPFQRDKILGTLRYSAPEYRCGGTIGHRSDQFSIAVIIYEMLTGKIPYGEKYENAHSIKDFQRLTYIHAQKHNPLVPTWLDHALEKALHTLPAQRYPALSEFVQDIKRPNPRWTGPQAIPLLQRNPLKVWQLISGIGWAMALYLIIEKLT
ncbi:MAG: serine/threonine protein phosphatase PrpC [Flavobacteriales bacterium]|jgi:serine/threonine protein phosphatase PrpC